MMQFDPQNGIVDLAHFFGRKAQIEAANSGFHNGGRTYPTIDTSELMSTVFSPVKWIVPGYVPEGLTVLAGRQKLGKSYLALDIAIAVASGGMAMGSIAVEQGDVLYIDLENGSRRIQQRIHQLAPTEAMRQHLGRLKWQTDAPALDAGLIALLEQWFQSVENPRLIIIDVLQRVKPAGKGARNAYENDYSIMAPLQRWANEHGVAVVVLHHTRKGGADDPLEALSGSNGLSACADTTLVLNKTGGNLTLYVRGRDVEEKETAMHFNDGHWTVVGDAAEVRRNREREDILGVLYQADELLTPSQIASALGKRTNNINQLLFKMVNSGEVLKCGRGKYRHPRRTDLDQKAADKSDKE